MEAEWGARVAARVAAEIQAALAVDHAGVAIAEAVTGVEAVAAAGAVAGAEQRVAVAPAALLAVPSVPPSLPAVSRWRPDAQRTLGLN